MVQEVNIQQVASFQVFVRDNKPKMNANYPFLSQEQILSKLRQQWKKLDDSKRRSYSKLVLTKKKAVKVTKVQVVKITRCRLPKGKQTAASKNAGIVRNKDDDDNFGFNNLSDDSNIHEDYESDSRSSNSPFMRNKFAIDSLNSGFYLDANKPTENAKKNGIGKAFGSCVSRVASETVDKCKTGISQTPWKGRRNSKGCVRFSAVKETVSDHRSYEFDNEDIDDEVFYIESSTRSKTNTSYESTCRNKAVGMMMPRRLNLQEVEDYSWMLSFQDNPAAKYSLAGGELKMPQSKYSLAGGELKMPQSKYSLAGGELKMPQSKYSLAGGELKMPHYQYSRAGGEMKMPQSKYSLASGDMKMPQSKYSLAGGDMKMPQSKYSLAGGELKMPHSKYSLPVGEPNMPQSKYSLAGGELKMPQSKYSLPVGELKMPQSKYSLSSGEMKMPQSRYSLAGGELRMPQSKKQKLSLETPDKTTTVMPSKSTPSRFSRRLRNMAPDDVSTTPCGRSLHGSSTVYLNKKPNRISEFCKKETFSVKNNITSFARKGQSFCSEFPNFAVEVKVRSCRHDNVSVTIDDQDVLQIVSDDIVGAHGTFQSKHKELQNKAAVDRNNVSTKFSSHILDCGAGGFITRFSSGPITSGCQLPVFDFPQSTKCVQSTGCKSDPSDVTCLKTSSVKISQKVNGDFSGRNTHWKDDDRFRLSDEESDSDFGDRGLFDKNDTVSRAAYHAGTKHVSVYEANLKTRINKKSENVNTLFGRENNSCKTKVDDSDKENDGECDDKDGCYKEDIVHTGVYQTGKQTDSLVETYLKKSTMKKYGNIAFDFCGRESDIQRKYIVSSDKEINGGVDDKDSFIRNDTDNKELCYRSQKNTREACSKRNTFKETERTISYLSRNRNYNYRKDTDICKEHEEENKEFDDVKDVPRTKVSSILGRYDDVQPDKENSCYQANRAPDPLAVYTNNTAERTTETNKGKIFNKCQKHVMATRNMIKQVSDKTFVKHGSPMDTVEAAEHKHSKSENAFHRKSSKSMQKQKNKSKMPKKSAVTRKHTTVNHVRCGNNVKRSLSGTFGNYGIHDSLTSPVALEYGIIQQESDLDNSSTNEEIQHENDLNNSSTNEEIQHENDLNNSSTNEEIQHENDLDNSSTHEVIQHESDLNNSSTHEEIQHENDLDNSSTHEEIQHESDLNNSSTNEEIQQESDLDNSSTNEEIQQESDLDNLNKSNIIHESHLNNSSTNEIITFSSQLNNSITKHTKELGDQQFPSSKKTQNFDVENLKLPTDFSKGSTERLQSRPLLTEDCSCTSNIHCRKSCQMDCKNMSIMDYRNMSSLDCVNDPQILWKAEDGFSSDKEPGGSDSSLGSDAGEYEETNDDVFLKNMADQTTSALLQAIDRLKSLTPPQVNLTGEGVSECVPSDLPENNDLASVSTEPLLLSGMFQDVPQNFSRAFVTPAKKRLLASSATETPSNFMAMFDDGEIFL